MLARVRSCAIVGLDAEPIEVEVDIASGLERLTVVGLPSAAVRESGERVRSAIANSGFFYPQHRLTVNLAPADLRKEGPAYDLPIALGIMAASRQVLADLGRRARRRRTGSGWGGTPRQRRAFDGRNGPAARLPPPLSSRAQRIRSSPHRRHRRLPGLPSQ